MRPGQPATFGSEALDLTVVRPVERQDRVSLEIPHKRPDCKHTFDPLSGSGWISNGRRCSRQSSKLSHIVKAASSSWSMLIYTS